MLKKIYFSWALLIVCAFCLLSGCSQIQTTTAPSMRLPEIKKPEYHKMANDYLKQALQATKNLDIQEYKLKAAEYFILAEEIDRAVELSNNIEITNQNHEAYLSIIKAQIALYKNQPELAQATLQYIWEPKQLPTDLQIKFYQTYADLHLRTENTIEAAKDNIVLEQLLTDPAEKQYKSKEIWNILSKLTPSALQDLQQHSDDYNVKGWLSFTHMIKQYDTNPDQMARAIAIWKKSYTSHPANNLLPEQDDSTVTNIGSEQPQHIALLLPLKGPHANSAEIIRDGFLAAHYEQTKSNAITTEVHIYDTTSNGVAKAYDKAIDDNSDFIVGPLIKDDVDTITAISNRHTPILALNTTLAATHSHRSNLFQFGLLPETDVAELAEQVWHDGHRRMLIFVPVGDWGKRIATAFKTNFGQYVDVTLAIEKIAPNDEDLSKKMSIILDIATNEHRIEKSKHAGLNIDAEPKRRQDIDAIIIATSPELARQLKPLLNFYYAGNIPVYAHSSIYNGTPAPIQDQDLNGIIFCDMPWVLDSSIASKAIYKNILTLWPNKLAQSPRLYAFGIDAYKIANQIQQLKTLPDFGVSGMTGLLTLDAEQKIQRKLMWAKFTDGIPKLLDSK